MVSPLHASSLFPSVSNAKEQPGGENDIQAALRHCVAIAGDVASTTSNYHREAEFGFGLCTAPDQTVTPLPTVHMGEKGG